MNRWILLIFPLICFSNIVTKTPKVQAQQTTNYNCPKPALQRLKNHRIAPGETLEGIARQYNLIPATLIGMNPVLEQGKLPGGCRNCHSPYNGIRVEVGALKTWRDIAATYKVRPDVLFEVNGCQQNPSVVFVPGVNWSPTNPSGRPTSQLPATDVITGYPLKENAPILLRYGWQLMPLRGEVAFHSGVDLQAKTGTPVLAAADGIVAFAGPQGNYGNLVVINHAVGKQTRYAHLGTISVRSGQRINRGQILGTVGITGNPDIKEPHLHFEVRSSSQLGWVAEDPQTYFTAMP